MLQKLLLSVLAELALFYSLRSQLVIKMMLASAKIDLPIPNELGFSLPVDSEVAPKGIGFLLSVPDTRQGQDQNYVQALKEMKDRYNQLRRGRIGFQLELGKGCTHLPTIEDWLLAYIKELRN